MTPYDRLKELTNKQGISLNKLEENIGLGKNTLYSWKKKIPSGQNLTKVADYFNVSTDYLLGRTDDPGFSSKNDEGFLRLNMTGFTDSEKDEVHQEIKDVIELAKRRFERRKNGN